MGPGRTLMLNSSTATVEKFYSDVTDFIEGRAGTRWRTAGPHSQPPIPANSFSRLENMCRSECSFGVRMQGRDHGTDYEGEIGEWTLNSAGGKNENRDYRHELPKLQ